MDNPSQSTETWRIVSANPHDAGISKDRINSHPQRIPSHSAWGLILLRKPSCFSVVSAMREIFSSRLWVRQVHNSRGYFSIFLEFETSLRRSSEEGLAVLAGRRHVIQSRGLSPPESCVYSRAAPGPPTAITLGTRSPGAGSLGNSACGSVWYQ